MRRARRITPVPKAHAIAPRPAPSGNDSRQDHEAREHANLERGKDKLGLARVPDGQVVQADDGDEKDRDEDGVGHGRAPVADDERRGRNLKGHQHRVRVPVVPAHGEPKRPGEEPRRVRVRAGAAVERRQGGGHLEHERRKDPDHGAGGDEAGESERGAASAQGPAGADQESRANTSCLIVWSSLLAKYLPPAHFFETRQRN